jgi:hypothetical protein
VQAGRTLSAYLADVSAPRTDTTLTFALDKIPSGSGSAYLTVVGRRVGTSEYAARVKVLSTGVLQLHVSRNGTVVAGGTVTGVTAAANERLALRLQVVGSAPTTVSARIWRATSTEPASWQATMTDSTTVLQGAGGVGLVSYLSGGTANAPVTISWDDIAVVTG